MHALTGVATLIRLDLEPSPLAQGAAQGPGIGSSLKKMAFRIAGVVLMAYMLSFASCDTVPICWYCENPHNPSEWQHVCNAMTKSKLESYGYICTPY